MVWQGEARQCRTWLGEAAQDKEFTTIKANRFGGGFIWRGSAWRGMAGPGKARRGLVRHDKATQDKGFTRTNSGLTELES